MYVCKNSWYILLDSEAVPSSILHGSQRGRRVTNRAPLVPHARAPERSRVSASRQDRELPEEEKKVGSGAGSNGESSMQGAATVDDRPTTSGDDDDRIVMVKLLIALASLEPNDKRLNLF